MKTKAMLIGLAIVCLAGCATTATLTPDEDLQSLKRQVVTIQVGQSQNTVINFIGHPTTKQTIMNSSGTIEIWTYTLVTLIVNIPDKNNPAAKTAAWKVARGAAGQYETDIILTFQNGIVTTIQKMHEFS